MTDGGRCWTPLFQADVTAIEEIDAAVAILGAADSAQWQGGAAEAFRALRDRDYTDLVTMRSELSDLAWLVGAHRASLADLVTGLSGAGPVSGTASAPVLTPPLSAHWSRFPGISWTYS